MIMIQDNMGLNIVENISFFQISDADEWQSIKYLNVYEKLYETISNKKTSELTNGQSFEEILFSFTFESQITCLFM